jgi:hypothetical protein
LALVDYFKEAEVHSSLVHFELRIILNSVVFLLHL